MAALYLTCNRNKRDIVLDLKQPAAREALMQIAKDVDVVIHNNRPQVMTKLGLTYERLQGREAEDHLLRQLRLRQGRSLRRQGRAGRFHPGGRRRRRAQRDGAGRTALPAHRDLRQDHGHGGRLCGERRAVSSRTAPAKARKSKCRCSSTWCTSSWPSTCGA